MLATAWRVAVFLRRDGDGAHRVAHHAYAAIRRNAPVLLAARWSRIEGTKARLAAHKSSDRAAQVWVVRAAPEPLCARGSTETARSATDIVVPGYEQGPVHAHQ